MGWDGFGNSVIPIHVHILNLRGLRVLFVRVTVRREIQYHIFDYRVQVVGEGGTVPHRNWVRQCVVDTVCHLA